MVTGRGVTLAAVSPTRLIVLLSSLGLLVSCGAVKLPFRVAGAVAQGTARAGKRAADSTSAAMERRRKAKEAAEKQKEAEEQKKTAKEAPAADGATPESQTAPKEEFLPPLPEPDLPEDLPLPYPGELDPP